MFPLAALTPIIELLRSCVMGVMRPLGDRVRRAPSLWRPEHRLIPEPLVALIQAWLQKRRQLIEALIHRIAEGRHVGRAYRPRDPKPGAVPKPRRQIPPEQQLPPRVVGWINRMASEVNCHGAGLLHLVGLPEMRAMILASPQMARLWVPLLNAMGPAPAGLVAQAAAPPEAGATLAANAAPAPASRAATAPPGPKSPRLRPGGRVARENSAAAARAAAAGARSPPRRSCRTIRSGAARAGRAARRKALDRALGAAIDPPDRRNLTLGRRASILLRFRNEVVVVHIEGHANRRRD